MWVGEVKMLNYNNLNDVEFEELCQDIIEKKLGVQLHRFAEGRDGGIMPAQEREFPSLGIQFSVDLFQDRMGQVGSKHR